MDERPDQGTELVMKGNEEEEKGKLMNNESENKTSKQKDTTQKKMKIIIPLAVILLIVLVGLFVFFNKSEKEVLLGSIETGGTKIICAVGLRNGKIIDQIQVPTETPDKSMPKVVEFFKKYPIKALGIASFGPIDINPKSEKYGKLLTKVKPNWQDFGLVDALKCLNVPIKIDTDVNGSCIGEMNFGIAQGLSNVLYITIGTGIGLGIASEGNMVHGILHPEAGHIGITKNPNDKGECVCPYHDSCFEGLASGPSLIKRYGLSHEEMKNKPEIWELEAEYIAKAILNYIYTTSPQKIIIGGGVLQGPKDRDEFFRLIREKVKQNDNGYYACPAMKDLENLIVPESLEGKQGILGGLVLADQALKESR